MADREPARPPPCESFVIHPQFTNIASGEFMFAVRSGNFHFSLMLATALSVSMLPSASRAYTDEQQQACSADAFRPIFRMSIASRPA